MATKIFFPYELAKKVAFNNQTTPTWNAIEQKSASGYRRNLVTQILPTVTISYTFPKLNKEEIGTLKGFFNARHGTVGSFYFSDWVNDKVQNARLIRDKEKGTYQLYCPQGDYLEQIFYASEFKVTVDGSVVTEFSHDDGVLTIPGTTAQSVVVADYRVYRKYHFKDSITITDLFYNAYRATMKLETTL